MTYAQLSKRATNLKGKKFGRLTIKNLAFTKRWCYWNCNCICGNKTIIRAGDLISGNTKSCGCLQIDRAKETNTRHGLSSSRFYKIWKHMITRCENPNTKYYRFYGERGIKVCKSWHKFNNFYKDLYEPYLAHCKQFGIKDTTIERINVNGDYKPSNCTWATAKQQANNRNSNHVIRHNGQILNITQWAKELNIKRTTIHQRIRYGWSNERILS